MTKPNESSCCASEVQSCETTESQPVETRTATPRQAVQRTGSGYELLLELPGVDPSRIALDVEGTTLSLRAEVDDLPELEDASNSFCEFGAFPFEARWNLPKDVDPEEITTTHERGVLTVVLPERAPQSRTIPVLES